MLENVCIESTTDYERFKTLTGNRKTIQNNVRRLVTSMRNNQLSSIAIVNGNDEIIDGQHRYEACKELGIPFYYITMRDYGIEEVHVLNSNMKNWTNDDYVHQFSERYEDGETVFLDYFRLVNFMETHNIRLNNALLLLENGIKSGTIPLRAGEFTISANMNLAEENLSELIDLEKMLGSEITTQAFWQTYIMCKRVKGFDSVRFFNKIKRARISLSEIKDTFRNLLYTFEEAYNTGRSLDLNIAYDAKQIEKEARKTKEVCNDD